MRAKITKGPAVAVAPPGAIAFAYEIDDPVTVLAGKRPAFAGRIKARETRNGVPAYKVAYGDADGDEQMAWWEGRMLAKAQ